MRLARVAAHQQPPSSFARRRSTSKLSKPVIEVSTYVRHTCSRHAAAPSNDQELEVRGADVVAIVGGIGTWSAAPGWQRNTGRNKRICTSTAGAGSQRSSPETRAAQSSKNGETGTHSYRTTCAIGCLVVPRAATRNDIIPSPALLTTSPVSSTAADASADAAVNDMYGSTELPSRM